MTKALGTNTRLKSRGMNLDPICQRCGLAPETIDPCLFTCPESLAIWRSTCSLFLLSLTSVNSVEEKLNILLSIQGETSLSLKNMEKN